MTLPTPSTSSSSVTLQSNFHEISAPPIIDHVDLDEEIITSQFTKAFNSVSQDPSKLQTHTSEVKLTGLMCAITGHIHSEEMRTLCKGMLDFSKTPVTEESVTALKMALNTKAPNKTGSSGGNVYRYLTTACQSALECQNLLTAEYLGGELSYQAILVKDCFDYAKYLAKIKDQPYSEQNSKKIDFFETPENIVNFVLRDVTQIEDLSAEDKKYLQKTFQDIGDKILIFIESAQNYATHNVKRFDNLQKQNLSRQRSGMTQKPNCVWRGLQCARRAFVSCFSGIRYAIRAVVIRCVGLKTKPTTTPQDIAADLLYIHRRVVAIASNSNDFNTLIRAGKSAIYVGSDADKTNSKHIYHASFPDVHRGIPMHYFDAKLIIDIPTLSQEKNPLTLSNFVDAVIFLGVKYSDVKFHLTRSKYTSYVWDNAKSTDGTLNVVININDKYCEYSINNSSKRVKRIYNPYDLVTCIHTQIVSEQMKANKKNPLQTSSSIDELIDKIQINDNERSFLEGDRLL